MVSREVKKFGKVVETIDQREYRKLEGLLKENLPMHVPIEIERKENKIKLWSRYPIVMKKALQKTRDMLKEYGTAAMSKVVPYEEREIVKRKTKKKRE